MQYKKRLAGKTVTKSLSSRHHNSSPILNRSQPLFNHLLNNHMNYRFNKSSSHFKLPQAIQQTGVGSISMETKAAPSQKNKGLAKKFVNFLQFLLYNSNSTTSPDILTGKELLVGGNRNLTSSQSGYDKSTQFDNTQLEVFPTQKGMNLSDWSGKQLFSNKDYSETGKKWNSFFPYRKSFVCYWLLPFMGFVSYLSSNGSKERDFYFSSLSSPIQQNAHCIISYNTRKGYFNNWEENHFQNVNHLKTDLTTDKSQFLIGMSTPIQSHLTHSFYPKESSLILSSSLSKGFQNFWYLNSFTYNSLPIRNSFNGVKNPFSTEAIYYSEKFYSVPLSNFDKVMASQKEVKAPLERKEFSSEFFEKTRIEPNKVHEKKLVKGFFNVTLFKGENRLLLNSNSLVPTVLLGIYPNNNDINVVTAKSNKEKDNIERRKHPILSYKKASLLMDELFKEINAFRDSKSSNVINLRNGFKNASTKSTLSVESLLAPVIKKENLKVYFPKSLNQMLKKNLLLHELNSKNQIPYNKPRNLSTLNPFLPAVTQKEEILLKKTNKSHLLEKMISFLNLKKKVSFSNVKEQKNSKDYSRERKKLQKEQLYSILFNSFRDSLDSLMNTGQDSKMELLSLKSDIERKSKEMKSVEEKFAVFSSHPNIIKLNHPLMFANLKKVNSQMNVDLLKPMDKENLIEQSPIFRSSPQNEMTIQPVSLFSGNTDFALYNRSFFEKGSNNTLQQLLPSSQKRRKEEMIPIFSEKSSFYSKYLSFLSLKFQQIQALPMSQFVKKNKGKEKRVEKIFRSYLSKKRGSFNSKNLNFYGVDQNFKLKTKNHLRRKGDILKRKKSALKAEEKITLNSILKNRAFLLKSTKVDFKKQGLSSFEKGVYLDSQFQKFAILNSLENRKELNSSFFINKEKKSNLLEREDETSQVSSNMAYFEKLEKRKYAQKKHRRKKQRKETRRRKKRKRFYPRPSWIRFRLYKNFLNRLSAPNSLINEETRPLRNETHPIKNSLKTNRKKKVNIFSSVDNIYVPKFQEKKTISLGSGHLLENLPLYSTQDFYQIKRSVLGELKRAFWKSYWLRSNLKPYLNRIKNDLKEIRNSSTKATFSMNLRNLFSFLSGLTENQFDLGQKPFINFESLQVGDLTPITQAKDANFYANLSFLNKQNPSIHWLGNQNKWQLITQISEHNRIMYERIQNLILNIRENLNINGQLKARPYQRSGHQKLKNLSSLRQNQAGGNDFWVKLGKKSASILFQSSYQYYGDLHKYRLYWAINKSHLGSYKPINKVKSIWMNTKNREQSKANKTKKILYNISTKYNSFLKHSNILSKKWRLQDQNLNFGINSRDSSVLESTLKKLNSPNSLIENNALLKEKLQKSLIVSERKLRQKEQKLRLMGGYNETLSNNASLEIFNKTSTMNQINNGKWKNSTVLIPGHHKKFTNEINYWWNESKMKFVPNFDNPFKNIGSTASLPLQDLKLQSQTEMTPLWVSSFLFHFCAIISLISISQIRDFMKFTLILLSKVSKIYFDLIYSSYHSFVNSVQNLKKPTKTNFYLNLDLAISKSRFLVGTATPIKRFKSLGMEKAPKEEIQQRKFSTRKSFYFLFINLVKKPFLLFQPFRTNIPNRKKRNFTETSTFIEKYNVAKTFYKVILYSSLNSLVFSLKNISFLTYTYFVKSLNFIETFVRSIYTFFEKPGELIIDWMAYLFLVEWASDLTNTIPDTVDTSMSHSIKKVSRSLRFPLTTTTYFTSRMVSAIPMGTPLLLGPLNNTSFGSPYSLTGSNFQLPYSFFAFSILGGGLIQRRILSMYEIFVNVACRPDTDLMIRQQKGQVFWDLWSDLLIDVAEDSNINISELSNLKEEQNRLLEKLIQLDSLSLKKKNPFIRSNKSSIKQLNSGLNPVLFGALSTFQKQKFQNKEEHMKRNSISRLYQDKQTPIWKRWSTNQFLSYQGKDTELFIDLHPPKSFSHLTSIKYSQSIQQPIGIVLCQIFSGLFYKQIAKNLLVVGSPGTEKSMLIQAIAGETELKIITDNAYRYAMVFRGVAVGIKLLRDVFEALTLHTPCLFLLEDIHAIGERRPFLISDDENTKGTESSFSSERDEVHEKNQVVYQLTKHIISHYKKPYKGDFSLLIPTNHFCFDLFNSSAPNEKRKNIHLTPLSPISLKNKYTPDNTNNTHQNEKTKKNSPWENSNEPFTNESKRVASSLQLKKNQLLAPPATSPFSVLVLKEEKKFKQRKIVKEFPWAGLPGEQFANVSKATYSIRVKVALLADMVLSNLSVKLDMITDLLVIIDSVKGNRGFVVFATTHVPYILDPALRRPGRFDETLALPQIPNLLSRWEIFKSNLSLSNNLKYSTLQKYSPSSSLNYNEPFSIFPIGVSLSLWQSHSLFEKSKLLIGGDTLKRGINSNFSKSNLTDPSTSILQKTNLSHSHNSPLNFDLGKVNSRFLIGAPATKTKNENISMIEQDSWNNVSFGRQASWISQDLPKVSHLPFFNYFNEDGKTAPRNSIDIPISDINQKEQSNSFSLKNKKNLTSNKVALQKMQKTSIRKVYSIVSQILMSLQHSIGTEESIRSSKTKESLTPNQTWGDFSFSMMNSFSNTALGSTIKRAISKDSLVYMSLYSSPHIFKQHLTILMAGQVGISLALSSNSLESNLKREKGNSLFITKTPNIYGIDKTWKTATSLVFSFVQKRWIYQKNLIIPQFLDFGPEGNKNQIPSPPSSNILLPAKRYENYKRTFTFSQFKRKTELSIGEKIQLHQQQRLVKRLYKIPLKEHFKSEILNNFNLEQGKEIDFSKVGKKSETLNQSKKSNYTSFANASIILAPLEKQLSKPTSINWFFRQRILNRHHTYLSNQWWNGQLQEHNTESTFLSDIDWRYSFFISSTPEGSMGDLFIDFPDAEQYYNPKNQRWINTSGSWNSWFDFDKPAYQQYSSHYIFECLANAYKCLDQNRELLDYYVVAILEKGIENSKDLDELEILELFKRFSGFS